MERIIITLDRQGNFRGASAQDWDGLPVPIDAAWLSSFAPTLNTAALARVVELEAEIAALQSAPPEPLPTESIKAWQAKAVLTLMGLLSAAESVIDSLEEPQRTIVKSAWDNNADFPRQSPTILSLAASLSLTVDQVDAMFEQAAALTV